MNRRFVLLAILLSQLVLAFHAVPVSAQQPESETLETKWKEIRYDGFSAQIPDSSFDSWGINEKELRFRMFSAETSTAWYFISAFDKLKGSPLFDLLGLARNNSASSSAVTIDDVPGVRLTFREVDSLQHEALVFLIQERVFIFHTISKHRLRADVDHLLDKSKAERFFDSIHLEFEKAEIEASPRTLSDRVKSFLGELKTDQPKEDSMLQVQRIPGSSAIPAESSEGSGIGSGSGSGSGSASPGKKEKITGESPIKILSTVRPGYTDLARKYNMKGRVVLRVTFLADGTIGDVAVVDALPLGLSDNAINAAKQIQFEPPARNGAAYTVNKPVQYNFTIY